MVMFPHRIEAFGFEGLDRFIANLGREESAFFMFNEKVSPRTTASKPNRLGLYGWLVYGCCFVLGYICWSLRPLDSYCLDRVSHDGSLLSAVNGAGPVCFLLIKSLIIGIK